MRTSIRFLIAVVAAVAFLFPNTSEAKQKHTKRAVQRLYIPPKDVDAEWTNWNMPGVHPACVGKDSASYQRCYDAAIALMPILMREVFHYPDGTIENLSQKILQHGEVGNFNNGDSLDHSMTGKQVTVRKVINWPLKMTGNGNGIYDVRRYEKWSDTTDGIIRTLYLPLVCFNVSDRVVPLPPPKDVCQPPPQPAPVVEVKKECREFRFPGTPGHTMVYSIYTENGEPFLATECDGIRQGEGQAVKQADCIGCGVGSDQAQKDGYSRKPTYTRSFKITSVKVALLVPESNFEVVFCDLTEAGITMTKEYILRSEEFGLSDAAAAFRGSPSSRKRVVYARPDWGAKLY